MDFLYSPCFLWVLIFPTDQCKTIRSDELSSSILQNWFISVPPVFFFSSLGLHIWSLLSFQSCFLYRPSTLSTYLTPSAFYLFDFYTSPMTFQSFSPDHPNDLICAAFLALNRNCLILVLSNYMYLSLSHLNQFFVCVFPVRIDGIFGD